MVGHDRLVTVYKRNVNDELYIHDLKSGRQLKRLAPNHVGTLAAYGRRDQQIFFVSLSGFDTPGTIARYDFSESDGGKADGIWKIWRETKVAGLAGRAGILTDQVWYQSKDGTKIPMFVVRHKDTPLDGSAPAIQYGGCVSEVSEAMRLTALKVTAGFLSRSGHSLVRPSLLLCTHMALCLQCQIFVAVANSVKNGTLQGHASARCVDSMFGKIGNRKRISR